MLINRTIYNDANSFIFTHYSLLYIIKLSALNQFYNYFSYEV